MKRLLTCLVLLGGALMFAGCQPRGGATGGGPAAGPQKKASQPAPAKTPAGTPVKNRPRTPPIPGNPVNPPAYSL